MTPSQIKNTAGNNIKCQNICPCFACSCHLSLLLHSKEHFQGSVKKQNNKRLEYLEEKFTDALKKQVDGGAY